MDKCNYISIILKDPRPIPYNAIVWKPMFCTSRFDFEPLNVSAISFTDILECFMSMCSTHWHKFFVTSGKSLWIRVLCFLQLAQAFWHLTSEFSEKILKYNFPATVFGQTVRNYIKIFFLEGASEANFILIIRFSFFSMEENQAHVFNCLSIFFDWMQSNEWGVLETITLWKSCFY